MRAVLLSLTGLLLIAAAAGGKSEEIAKPPGPAPVAEKVPGKDYPYGEGVVYKREVLFGNRSNRGDQGGPGSQMECNIPVVCRAPNGDWYILDQGFTYDGEPKFYRYDMAKKRVVRIGGAGPYGKRGGPIESARFASGWYHRGMVLSMDPQGKTLRIFDRNNGDIYWGMDVKTGMVERAQGVVDGTAVRGSAPDGTFYYTMGDGKLKKMLPDGKTVQDLGVTLEPPIRFSVFFGDVCVSEPTGRLYALVRDPSTPWGIVWYWDMKTGKATGVAGPSKEQWEKNKEKLDIGKPSCCISGPADQVSFFCCGGPSLGPDLGQRYVYIGGGDESTISRVDLDKKYVTKLVHADAKDRSLWTFGEGRQGKDYKACDPYDWPGPPIWGSEGEFYMRWGQRPIVDVYRPVTK